MTQYSNIIIHSLLSSLSYSVDYNRYKVLTYDIKQRVREIIAVVAEELNIKRDNGVRSSDHIHIFANIPPHIKVSEFVKKLKEDRQKRYKKNVQY